MSRGKRVAFTAVLLLGVPLVGVVALEGISSLVLFARDAFAATRPVFSEEITTQYDSELGWIGKASYAAPNHWGPGMHLHTNARGFRGQAAVSDAKPNGKRRLLCSGDSYTLGVGVGDSYVWCSLLARDDLETVNMGQGGYGIDQAYLWYKRDAREMAHDVQLFSFVTDDFTRMSLVSFLGYGKPRLMLAGDSLRVDGVPVPRRSRGRTTLRLLEVVRTLRSYELMGGQTRSSGGGAGGGGGRRAGPPRTQADTSGTRDVFARVVADLKRVNESKQSRLALIYMPDQSDYANDGASVWRAVAKRIADSLGVPFIDMVSEIRKLSRVEAPSIYIRDEDVLGLGGAARHFNIAGNRWAADVIRSRLDSLGILPAPMVTRVTR